ncbi:hypothetical protein GJ744_008414 [Endocarpon pusillum]|uniref:Uncharacterized protein n=1 Tax=Endocarpon pusillum TaxID=364733 RepID=A0A8H7E3C2_9EURO|nr:hypothetical protein GJ744_008414 [Endocarpon pusillum]
MLHRPKVDVNWSESWICNSGSDGEVLASSQAEMHMPTPKAQLWTDMGVHWSLGQRNSAASETVLERCRK